MSKEITPTEALQMDRESLLIGLIEGRYRFPESMIKHRKRIVFGDLWYPRLEHYVEVSDDENSITLD